MHYYKNAGRKSSADPLDGMVKLKIHELQVTIREKSLTTTNVRPAMAAVFPLPTPKAMFISTLF